MWKGGSAGREWLPSKPSVSCHAPLCLPASGQASSPGTQGVRGQSGELQEAVCPQAVEGASRLRAGGWGCKGCSWVPGSLRDLCAHSDVAVPFLSVPQLSFSIVSLCNHLTRSLMKKVHLRPDETLVGKCSAPFCGGTLGWPGAWG